MNYLINKEQYLSAKAAWNCITSRTPADHIIYNAIRGFDIKRGFTAITSSIKLSNGAYDWQGFNAARAEAEHLFRPPFHWPQDEASLALVYEERMKNLSKRFGIEFTLELMAKMREVLK